MQPPLPFLHHTEHPGRSGEPADWFSHGRSGGIGQAGVRELLVVSQDTSAYGVDLKYQTDFWQGRPLKSNLEALASALSEMGICPFSLRIPLPHVDALIPMMAQGKLLPYIDMPLQHGASSVLQRMKRPAASKTWIASPGGETSVLN